MDAIFEWVYIIAGINLLYVLFARAVSFILGLFIQKFRFFLASVFATWIVIILLIFLLRNSTIFNSFFAYILFPSICMLILYFLGKLSNVSFSRGEYIYIFLPCIYCHKLFFYSTSYLFFSENECFHTICYKTYQIIYFLSAGLIPYAATHRENQ